TTVGFAVEIPLAIHGYRHVRGAVAREVKEAVERPSPRNGAQFVHSTSIIAAALVSSPEKVACTIQNDPFGVSAGRSVEDIERVVDPTRARRRELIYSATTTGEIGERRRAI